MQRLDKDQFLENAAMDLYKKSYKKLTPKERYEVDAYAEERYEDTYGVPLRFSNKPTKVQLLQDLDNIDNILKFNELEQNFSASDILVFSDNNFHLLSEFSDMNNFGVISKTIRKVARKVGDTIKGNDVFPFNQANVGRLLTDARFRVEGENAPQWKAMSGQDLTNAKDYLDMKGFNLTAAWYDSNINNWEVDTQKRACYFWYKGKEGDVLARGTYTPAKGASVAAPGEDFDPTGKFKLRLGKKYPSRNIKEIAVSRSGNLVFRDKIR